MDYESLRNQFLKNIQYKRDRPKREKEQAKQQKLKEQQQQQFQRQLYMEKQRKFLHKSKHKNTPQHLIPPLPPSILELQRRARFIQQLRANFMPNPTSRIQSTYNRRQARKHRKRNHTHTFLPDPFYRL